MMTNKKIYILLTDTGSVLTKLIRLYTKKRYNHVSISFDVDLREVYSFGRKRMNNPFNGGFVRENIREGLFKEATCSIYSITVTENQIENMKAFIKKIEREKDVYRYNFLGLFGFLFNRPIQREKAFFCSQFVASVLQEGKVLDLNKQPALISPSDIEGCTALELVYEGKLKHYQREESVQFHVSNALVAMDG